MRDRRRRLRNDDTRDWRQIERQFLEDENLVVADLDRVVEFVDYVYPADAFGGIEGEIYLIPGNIIGRDDRNI